MHRASQAAALSPAGSGTTPATLCHSRSLSRRDQPLSWPVWAAAADSRAPPFAPQTPGGASLSAQRENCLVVGHGGSGTSLPSTVLYLLFSQKRWNGPASKGTGWVCREARGRGSCPAPAAVAALRVVSAVFA